MHVASLRVSTIVFSFVATELALLGTIVVNFRKKNCNIAVFVLAALRCYYRETVFFARQRNFVWRTRRSLSSKEEEKAVLEARCFTGN